MDFKPSGNLQISHTILTWNDIKKIPGIYQINGALSYAYIIVIDGGSGYSYLLVDTRNNTIYSAGGWEKNQFTKVDKQLQIGFV